VKRRTAHYTYFSCQVKEFATGGGGREGDIYICVAAVFGLMITGVQLDAMEAGA